MNNKHLILEILENIVFVAMMVWTVFTTFLIFGPTVAVLQTKNNAHIAVVHMENNNTEFHKELNLLVKRYTEKD